jgi:hypothetical protein
MMVLGLTFRVVVLFPATMLALGWDKSGNSWAGRGAQPRWLTAAIKAGATRDDFLVDKSARKVRKKWRSKK